MERVATWAKPGPGTWELDSSHCGPAPGPILRGLYEQGFARGFAEGFSLFGSPLSGMHMRWVNGKFYRRLVPLVGGSRDLPAPPAAAVWLLSRVHPAFRRQEKRAAESFSTKRWRAELDRWEREWKPGLIAAHTAAGAVEVQRARRRRSGRASRRRPRPTSRLDRAALQVARFRHGSSRRPHAAPRGLGIEPDATFDVLRGRRRQRGPRPSNSGPSPARCGLRVGIPQPSRRLTRSARHRPRRARCSTTTWPSTALV